LEYDLRAALAFVLLLGAQGMDDGARLLEKNLDRRAEVG
jgi:hypothetical protein